MRRSLQLRASAEDAGQRLDEFLAARIAHLSRMRIASLLLEGACKLNKETALAGQHLKEGDLIELVLNEEAPGAMTPEPLPLEIIYEDAQLLVLVKAAGVLVHPTRGVKTGTLMNALTYHLNQSPQTETRDTPSVIRPGLVHRLDKETSGLMVVAKQQRALSILTRHFHHRLVEKRYLALVHGRVKEDEIIVRAPIGRDDQGPPHWRVTQEGREAETRLRVIERRARLAFIELEPVTGRTNQLRIHCAHTGHPIVGDKLYGAQDQATRLCLHAARLAFHHPAGGAWMEFNSPLPPEIAEIFNAAP